MAAGLSDDGVKLLTSAFWPVVVLILACVYIQPITGLLRRLTSVKGPGFQADFREQAARALETASAISGDAAEPDAETKTLISQAAKDPWWVVRQSWRRVRAAARAAAGGHLGDGITTPGRVKALSAQGLVGEDAYRLAQTLSRGYFSMKDNPGQITPAVASDYADAAGTLVRTLRSVPPQRQPVAVARALPDDEGPSDA